MTHERIVRYIGNPQPESAIQILTWFRSLQKYHGFHDVLLVDASGQPQLSLSRRSGPLNPEATEALSTAWRERRCVLSDLYVLSGDPAFKIDTIIPFFITNGRSEPIGAVVEQIDARQYLYPLIQSWPFPSQSAETLLVRRDGDAVLFLNDLRHRQNAALKMRIPLNREDVPAVMAVLGKEGVMEGKDYRGIEVLSILKAVPDSPWFMVAKIDKSEILANWRFLSILILALIAGLAAVLTSAMGMVWQ